MPRMLFQIDADPVPGQTPSLDAFFSYGFRPFFLGASVYAVLLMSGWLVWIGQWSSGATAHWLTVTGSPFAWHAHEMVFGFAAAAIAGFLLTAVPNWTGSLPLSGPPLILLFIVWLAGRMAMAVSGHFPLAAPVIDLAFLPLLAAFATRQLLVKPAARNFGFVVILAALTLGNAAYHAATLGLIGRDPLVIMRVALLLVALMITIIGGRIVPAFTHNWLHLNAIEGPMPSRAGWLDGLSVVSAAAVAVSIACEVPSELLCAMALLAAGSNGARLALWRGLATRREPIVWVLHVGYAWIVIGFALVALSAMTAAIPPSVASHAFATGAVGTMVMAVMSRAALGHTGRPISAPRAIVWAYGLVSLAAVFRVLGPLILPGVMGPVLGLAALAWIAAYALFAIVYAPILTTPRVHTKVARARDTVRNAG